MNHRFLNLFVIAGRKKQANAWADGKRLPKFSVPGNGFIDEIKDWKAPDCYKGVIEKVAE